MRNIKRILIPIIIGIIIISSTGCKMVKKTDEAIKKSPVAKVDGEKITKEDLDKRMKPIEVQYNNQYGSGWESNSQAKSAFDEEKKSTREQMINGILVLQHAKKAKVLPTTKEINDAFKTQYDNYVKQQAQGDEKQFISMLQQYGFTKNSYSDYLKEQIKVSLAKDKLLKDVKVDDSEIQKEYDTNKDIKYTEQPSKMHIQHILVASEDDAKKVVDRLNKGEDFAAVAKEVSTDTQTKDNSGELGDYYYNSELNQQPLDEDFMKAAMAVENGKISAPVKTQYGWHVIKVTNKTVYPAKKFEDVKEEIRTSLLETKKQDQINTDLKKWKKDLGKKLKTYDKNM